MLDCQEKFAMPVIDGEDVVYTCPYGYAKIAIYIDDGTSLESPSLCQKVRKAIEGFCPLDNNQKCRLVDTWGK